MKNALDLSRTLAWLSVEMQEAATKKCKELGARGFFATIDEGERGSDCDQDQVTFHFTTQIPWDEFEEMRECQNKLADRFFYAETIAVLNLREVGDRMEWEDATIFHIHNHDPIISEIKSSKKILPIAAASNEEPKKFFVGITTAERNFQPWIVTEPLFDSEEEAKEELKKLLEDIKNPAKNSEPKNRLYFFRGVTEDSPPCNSYRRSVESAISSALDEKTAADIKRRLDS